MLTLIIAVAIISCIAGMFIGVALNQISVIDEMEAKNYRPTINHLSVTKPEYLQEQKGLNTICHTAEEAQVLYMLN